ncbi:DUF3515 domain-containing protein [Williamsia sp. CHRR-6]|nr:DUF3515 domain-containing protein [Williamsia sp. CHRR-6]
MSADADHEATSGSDHDRPRSAALIATVVAIPVVVIVAFIVFAAARPDPSDPALPLPTITAPQSTEPACAKLIAALPRTFAGFAARTETDGLIEWREQGSGTGPLQLKCGVQRPNDLAPTSALLTVNAVQWFSRSSTAPGTLWFAVDHRPYVALWIPDNAGNGPITDITDVIDTVLARSTIDLG